MFIRSIRFRNWKAFADTKFEFPSPESEKNVVLISAKNGFGKTSLLEGVILGLFGRDGFRIIGRADSAGDSQRVDISYNNFLERAFHAQAKQHGQSSATIELTFEDEIEGPISIQRIWHFSGSGKHRRDEEELRIWVGRDNELLPIPPLEDREEFIRSYISRQFLPVDLAQFFLFDGEQVQRLAHRDMNKQVRLGIEGILGVPILRELKEDLNRYARDRRRKVNNVGDEKIDSLRAQIREKESEEEQIKQELKETNDQIEPLCKRRDQLQNEITSLSGGTYASLKELFEDKERFSRNRQQKQEELRRLLSFDVALALAGQPLREATKDQLIAESKREKWEIGKNQGDESFDRFISSLGKTQPRIDPPLTEKQVETLQEKLRNAWQNLWYPPPEGCADSYRHGYLHEPDRNHIKERLERVDNITISQISGLLQKIEEMDKEIRKLDRQISQQQGVEKEAQQLTDELQECQEKINELDNNRRDLERRLDGLYGELNPKRQELGRLQESYSAAIPQLRRSALADKTAIMINSIVEEAFPSHVEDVAQAMTEAYLSMAHKGVVEKICINYDCTVQLLGSGGYDIRKLDASAGENQIFALSLIAAIAQVSDRSFPIIIDTPLARLDHDHRRNVLEFFTRTNNQVVMLSHPEEVTGDYYELIKPKLLKCYNVKHKVIADGIGKSTIDNVNF